MRFTLLCCFLALFTFSPRCEAMPAEWQDSFREALQLIIDMRPKYTWGGAESLDKGLDCSGYIFLACKWAGIPGITRTTALNMARGMGGWQGDDVEWHQSEPLDLIWWTFPSKPDRIHGHVGVLWYDNDGYHMVTHASASRNRVVVDKLRYSLWDDISKIRHLTIGDKP